MSDAGVTDPAANPRTDSSAYDSECRLFHITHWKAGSQWVRKVLQRACNEAVTDGIPSTRPVPPGVYTPVYMHRDWFYQEVPQMPDDRRVVVIRDLRDSIVSWYFSILYSHEANPGVERAKSELQALSVEDGLIRAMGITGVPMAQIQTSWLHAVEGERLYMRYEDLLEDEVGCMDRILLYFGLGTDEDTRHRAIESMNFQKVTGRERGQEDISRHERKGVAGDWRNHFTDRVKDAFKEQFGKVLIDTGYEQSTGW